MSPFQKRFNLAQSSISCQAPTTSIERATKSTERVRNKRDKLCVYCMWGNNLVNLHWKLLGRQYKHQRAQSQAKQGKL